VEDTTGATDFLMLGAQADEFMPAPCNALTNYIEGSGCGLPLVVTSIIEKIFIFQVKPDKKNYDLPRNKFVVSRAFQPTKAPIQQIDCHPQLTLCGTEHLSHPEDQARGVDTPPPTPIQTQTDIGARYD
jgi:hypothetical protein